MSKERNKIYVPLIIGIILIIVFQILGVFFSSFIFSMTVLFPGILIIELGAIIMLFFTIRYSVKRVKENKVQSFLPLILNALILALIFFNPFNRMIQYAEFSIKYNARMEAIHSYYDGELIKAKESVHSYSLKGNQFLSDGNEILKAGDKMLFFTVRGVLDNFSGYVYSPDGTPPSEEDVQADFLERRKVHEHWYYIVCT